MNNKLRNDITKIAQGNIQEVLMPILDRIEALEESLDAMRSEPEIVNGPDVTEFSETEVLENETLEVENDLVQQNVEDEECEDLTEESSLNVNDQTKDSK